LRGIEGEMYMPRARPFLPEHLEKTKADIAKTGLHICSVDTSCSFNNADKWDAVIKEGKESIDLAQKLGAPFIRVFGGKFPDPANPEQTIALVARGLNELGAYAADKAITVLLETHGDFSASDILLQVFAQVDAEAVGILWDLEHPFIHCGEAIRETYDKLRPYIKHVHVKDSKDKSLPQPLCLIGEGDVPIAEAVHLLRGNGYDGWYSLEWEKKHKSYLPEPEEALPGYAAYMKAVWQ